MVENAFTVIQQNFPVEFTENFQVVDPSADQFFGGTDVIAANDVTTSSSMTRSFQLLVETFGAGTGATFRFSHRNIRVPITDPASPLFTDDFFTQSTNVAVNFIILERERTATDVLYDLFYVSDNVAQDIDLALTVVTYTLAPGDTIPVFSIPTDAVRSRTVLRSKDGLKRTYDVFVLSTT